MIYDQSFNSFNIAAEVLKGEHKTLKLVHRPDSGVYDLVAEWECPLRPVRAIVASWYDNPLRPTVEVLKRAHSKVRREQWRRLFGEPPR